MREPVPEEKRKTPEEVIEEIRRPSKGDELLQRIKESIKVRDISTNESTEKVTQNAPSDPKKDDKKDFVGTIKNGVEVVDVKIIPKEEDQKGSVYVDKFGIPHRGPRKTWDKI